MKGMYFLFFMAVFLNRLKKTPCKNSSALLVLTEQPINHPHNTLMLSNLHNHIVFILKKGYLLGNPGTGQSMKPPIIQYFP